MAYNLQLGAPYNAQINDNGQQRGDKAYSDGVRTDGATRWFYHMQCCWCGFGYIAGSNAVGKRRCPECDRGKACDHPPTNVEFAAIAVNRTNWIRLPLSVKPDRQGKRATAHPFIRQKPKLVEISRPTYQPTPYPQSLRLDEHMIDSAQDLARLGDDVPPSDGTTAAALRSDDGPVTQTELLITKEMIAEKVRDFHLSRSLPPSAPNGSPSFKAWQDCNHETRAHWERVVELAQHLSK